MIQVMTCVRDNCTFIFRMVAEPPFTMREGPGAMEDRETVEEYNEEMREIDNAYRMDDEKYETINDNEDKQQTLRLCRETEDVTIGMLKSFLKMNIKLPTPTQYDGKSPQFKEWAGEVKAYRTVHNVYIEDLLEDSTRSQVPMVIATMQRDAVANDLQGFNARYPHAIHHGEDGYDEYMDRWEAIEY
eukprot:6490520-Amphidinium_carterae.4